MQVPKHVFREYDVRGVVGRDLTEALALGLGKAVGTYVRRGGGKIVVVGRDHRESGASLSKALAEGLLSTGCDVVLIGVTPTPVQYWAIKHLGADGGVQVTGSHNPPEYNGFKMTLLGHSLSGAEIQGLWTCIDKDDFEVGRGKVHEKVVLEAYVDDLAKGLGPAPRRLKVVVDAGNGTGGITALPLYKKLGYDIVPLFCEPDGTFPNHHPDPTVTENLADLQKAVAKEKADIGLAFDGDADRIGVVDADGTIVWGDRLMILFARAVLEDKPGASIIGEVKCSKTLYDDIAKHGGKPVMWRAGHSLIKSKMKEIGAELAGEMSGHIFFKHRYYGFDDGVYAGARLLEILGKKQKSVGALLADVPVTFSTPELRVDCPDEHKFALVERVKNALRGAAGLEKLIDIDGVRAEWADGWGLVRPSNTQPLLVLRFEALSEARVSTLRAIFDGHIRDAKAALGI